jgi:hypothetical protein
VGDRRPQAHRGIAVISAIMVAGLAIAWVLLVVVGLGAIY